MECPDLDFVYNDTDTHPNEIAELYSYTEQTEFHLNVKVSEDNLRFNRIVFLSLMLLTMKNISLNRRSKSKWPITNWCRAGKS